MEERARRARRSRRGEAADERVGEELGLILRQLQLLRLLDRELANLFELLVGQLGGLCDVRRGWCGGGRGVCLVVSAAEDLLDEPVEGLVAVLVRLLLQLLAQEAEHVLGDGQRDRRQQDDRRLDAEAEHRVAAGSLRGIVTLEERLARGGEDDHLLRSRSLDSRAGQRDGELVVGDGAHRKTPALAWAFELAAATIESFLPRMRPPPGCFGALYVAIRMPATGR